MAPIDEPGVTAWLGQPEQLVAENIRKTGAHIRSVIADPTRMQSSIACTAGLFGIGHPELMALGLDGGAASWLRNEVASRVRRGSKLIAGEVRTFEA